MDTTIVNYTVTHDQAADNEALVRAVYAELERTAPVGLTYATYVQEDGVSFVHVASVETDEGPHPLTTAEAFRAFQVGLADRCAEPPTVRPVRLVGSYGSSGG